MTVVRHKTTLTYLAYALIYASVVVRGSSDFYAASRDLWWAAASLSLAYGVLLASEHWVTRRLGWYPHLYLGIQTGVTLALLLLSPQLDYFALLFIPLSGQAIIFFSQRTGFRWIAAFVIVTAGGLVYVYGWRDALPFWLIYVAAVSSPKIKRTC